MICLGIESTAHTLGIGIVNDRGKVLADEKSVYTPPVSEGMKPRETAEYHIKNVKSVIEKAIKKSKLKIRDVDIFAFSRGPGIPNCLAIGSSVSRFLSLKHEKPIIGVNHPCAHIEIAKLFTKTRDPVVLYCSGGNTQIIAYVSGRYRIFGETEDIPIGNALDVFARSLGMGMPGGPKIEDMAKHGKWVELPYVVKGMDFSFSGILTECIRKLNRGAKKEDLCYSLQEYCFSMLTEATERALAHTDKKSVLITGGVAANKHLFDMVNRMCEERGSKCYVVPLKYAGDCGSMIAWTGILAHKSREKNDLNNPIDKNWRIDQVDVTWIE